MPASLEPLSSFRLRATDGIVPLQSGTNQYDSQKVGIFGVTRVGTNLEEGLTPK